MLSPALRYRDKLFIFFLKPKLLAYIGFQGCEGIVNRRILRVLSSKRVRKGFKLYGKESAVEV